MASVKGKRGRGRPSEGKVKVCYLLAPDVIEFLRANEQPASRLIEEAIREYFKIAPKRVDND